MLLDEFFRFPAAKLRPNQIKRFLNLKTNLLLVGLHNIPVVLNAHGDFPGLF